MKVLIVDDSVIMRTAINKYASEMGLEIVATAGNGKQAVELFEQHLPDMVTLDITMPEMNGLEVLEKILAKKPDTKVLVITAVAEKSVAIDALRKGAKGFLNKPFNEETLKAAIDEVMKK